MLVGALLAISAVLLLFTQPQDVVFAQENGDPITYPEIIIPDAQGADFPPVQTFKSEDPEGAGVQWDVTGLDADDFEISANGELRFKEQPDFEDPTDRDDPATTGDDESAGAEKNMYEITVRATEVRPTGETRRALSTEMAVTVSVTNVDEKGEITLQWLEPEVGTDIQAQLEDPDGAPANVTFTWWVDKVSGTPDAKFDGHWEAIPGGPSQPIVEADIKLPANITLSTTTHKPRGKRASDVPDSEMHWPEEIRDEGKYLRVVATYSDTASAPADDPKKAYGVSMYPIRAERTSGETNSENGSPDFEPERVARTVSEDAAVGSNVGAPVLAKDPNTVNPQDHLTYHLMPFMGNNPDDPNGDPNDDGDYAGDVGFFDIDPETGQITVAKKLDFDANPTEENADGKYTVIVLATDPSDENNEATLTITATRANDSPVIMGGAELRVNELDSDDADGNGEPDDPYVPMTVKINNVVVTGNVYTAGDDDAVDQATWTLEGADAGVFVLNKQEGPDEPRELIFNPVNASPDYEAPTDANGDSVYKVTLVATDDSGAVDRRPVTVFVDNLQEAGKVTLYTGPDADMPLGEDSPVVGATLTAKVEDPDGGVTVVTWQWLSSPTQAGPYQKIIGETTATYTPTSGDADDAVYLRARATYIDTLTEVTDADNPDTPDIDERVQRVENAATTPKDPDNAHEGDDRLYEAEATSGNAVRAEAPDDGGGPGGPVTPGRPAPIVCDQGVISLEVAENAETGSFVGSPVEDCYGGQGMLSYDLHPAIPDNRSFSVMADVGSPGSPGFPQITVGSVNRTNGIVNADPVLDYETKSQYNIVIRATDEASPQQTNSFSVTINLKNLNEYPFFNQASLDKDAETYEEGRTTPVATYVATDPDGGPIDWYVTGTDADRFSIANGVLSFVNVPDFEKPMDGFDANNDGDFKDTEDIDDTVEVERDVLQDNVYDITVRATERTAIGGGPSISADLDVAVEVTDRDEPGTVTLQWLQPEVRTPIMALVTDPDMADANADATFTWYRAKVANPNRNPDLDPAEQASFLSEWEDLSVTGEEYIPQGDTDDDKIVLDEGQYLLAWATYKDKDGNDKNAVGISRYPVRQDVSDVDNGSPDFRDNERTIEVLETTPEGGAVGTVIVDEEPDGDTLTYELVPLGGDDLTQALNQNRDETNSNNADVDFFEIDPATGAVTVKKMLSYEADDDRTPYTGDDALTPGEYKFIVRATDPSGEGKDDGVEPAVYRDSDEITVTVKATQENEAPKVTEGLADLTINEANSREKEDGKANYFINLGYLPTGADSNLVLDPDNLNLYKDDDADAPDNPSWVVDGPDKDWFALATPDDGIGRRLVFEPGFEPDFENPSDTNRDNVYEVTVVVRDSSDVPRKQDDPGKQDVRVEVMNVWEEGKLTLTPEQPYVPGDQSTVTAELTDYDGVISYTYWHWYWTDTDTDLVFDGPLTAGVELDATVMTQGKIPGATTGTYTAREGDIGRYLHVRVEYRDAWSSVDNPITPEDERNVHPGNDYTTEEDYDHDSDEILRARTGNAVQTDPTTPKDPDPDPDPTDPGQTGPPAPTMQSFRTTVAENTPGSGYVRAPARLIDGLTYELDGPDAVHFVLADTLAEGDNEERVYATDNRQKKPGQLAVALSPEVAQLDYESGQNSYKFDLTATRETGRKDIIMVEDVNEAPTAPEKLGTSLVIVGWDTVHREEGDSLDVATYRIVGAEADLATWMALAGEDADAFDFNDGVLTFKAAPDFEMSLHQSAYDDVYRVRIAAQPSGDDVQDIRKEVEVTISNREEPGTVTLSTGMISVGGKITATVADPDGDVTNIMWQWARSDAMDGAFTDIDDAMDASYTPVDDDVEMYLRATASYDDGHGAGKSAMMVTANAVSVIPVDTCIADLGSLTASQTVMGAWASDCPSTAKSGSYARYYTFTLDSPMQVEMNLTSGVDAYLALRQGAGRTGTMVASNDNVGSRNFSSAINMMLVAGTYTVEATTYSAGQTGDFTLSVRPLQETEDLETLTGSVDRSNSMWVSDYMSTQQAGSYARSYTFTVDTATHVAINLTSPEDAYLYVLDSNGAAVHENDNVTTRNLNSRIDETLPAGMYTIEATTYFPARMGTFHLSIGVLP